MANVHVGAIGGMETGALSGATDAKTLSSAVGIAGMAGLSGDLIAGMQELNVASIAVVIASIVVIADGTSAPNAASIGVRERR